MYMYIISHDTACTYINTCIQEVFFVLYSRIHAYDVLHEYRIHNYLLSNELFQVWMSLAVFIATINCEVFQPPIMENITGNR